MDTPAAAAAAAAAPLCAAPGCGQPCTLLCSRCLDARYCDVSCQRAHWRVHKPSCQPLGAQPLPPLPPPLPASSFEPPYVLAMRALSERLREQVLRALAVCVDALARAQPLPPALLDLPPPFPSALLATACDGSGATLLHFAAYFNAPAAIHCLCDLGADANAWALGTPAPLHVAALRGHAPAVQALLARGARADLACPRAQRAARWRPSGPCSSRTFRP